MNKLLVVSVTYAICAAFVALWVQNGANAVGVLSFTAFVRANSMVQILFYPLILAAIALVLHRRSWRTRLSSLLQVLVAMMLIQLGFCLIKNSLTQLVPFHADTMLAQADFWLHGGRSPWEILHGIMPEQLVAQWVDFIYMRLWAIPGLCLPFVILALEGPTARARRHAWLYAWCWMALGSALAVIGSSAGPIYYERLLGSESDSFGFGALAASLSGDAFGHTLVSRVQNGLWNTYVENTMELGSGISAFPSMHVAMATVFALYLTERSRWLAPIGWGFWAATLFLSVYTGYHYALDGYVSTLCVCLGNLAIARLQGVRRARFGAVAGAVPVPVPVPVAVQVAVPVSGAARG